VKRLFDVTVTAVALLVLAVPMLVIGLAVLLVLGRPLFFVQERTGLHGKPFKLVKFRTMRDTYDADGQPLPNGQRMTRLGCFLRATSLDELPQLWNVLKGDMSLVGPRPLLVEYLPLYSSEQARRHAIRPGLTGWAQVNGRNAQSWEERFQLDVWYVDNRSLPLDLKILWMTVFRVLKSEGINPPGKTAMGKFSGADRQGSW
jgi:lipopolysaccharide/colanic/teichoic acid biosynthesis glycosyltransferase